MRSLQEILTEALVSNKVRKTEMEQEMTYCLEKFIDVKELTNDLISIIHHFSMKLYSNRKKKLKEIEKIIESAQD